MSPRPEQTRAIHVLKKQSGMTDGDYRAHLSARFAVRSSRDLTEAQAGTLLDELRAVTGQPKPAGCAQRASGKFAPVLQALWLAGYNLGIVTDPKDAALLAFVRRQCRVDHDRFLQDGADAQPAIEGLKAWIAREGGVVWQTSKDAKALGEPLVTLNKRAVVSAIAARIRATGLDGFEAENFAVLEGLPQIARCTGRQLDRLATKMGAVLRRQLGRA